MSWTICVPWSLTTCLVFVQLSLTISKISVQEAHEKGYMFIFNVLEVTPHVVVIDENWTPNLVSFYPASRIMAGKYDSLNSDGFKQKTPLIKQVMFWQAPKDMIWIKMLMKQSVILINGMIMAIMHRRIKWIGLQDRSRRKVRQYTSFPGMSMAQNT